MKKLLSLIACALLSALLVCVAAGCSCAKEPESPVGPVGPEPEPEHEAAMPAAETALLGPWYCMHDGMPVCLDLKDDNTYALTMLGTVRQGTWKVVSGCLVLDDADDAGMVIIEGNRIMWAEAGEFFRRDEVTGWRPAVLAAEAGIDDFAGYWVSYYVEADGLRLPSSVVRDTTELFIEGERVALGGLVFGDIVRDFTFADMALSYEDGDVGVLLQLQSDFLLRCTVNAAGTEFIIYLYPARLDELPRFAD